MSDFIRLFKEKGNLSFIGMRETAESLLPVERVERDKLYLQEDLRGKNVEKVKELATEKKVSISWTSKKSLTEMTEGAVHQGFVL